MSRGDSKPEERVNLAIGMIDACIRVCAEGIRNRSRGLADEEIKERIRERIVFARRRVSGV